MSKVSNMAFVKFLSLGLVIAGIVFGANSIDRVYHNAPGMINAAYLTMAILCVSLGTAMALPVLVQEMIDRFRAQTKAHLDKPKADSWE